MRTRLHRGLRTTCAITTGLALAGGVLGLTDRVRITLDRSAGGRTRWSSPWLHWCIFDQECQLYGAPRRIYVWPLKLFIDFPRRDEREHSDAPKQRLRLVENKGA